MEVRDCFGPKQKIVVKTSTRSPLLERDTEMNTTYQRNKATTRDCLKEATLQKAVALLICVQTRLQIHFKEQQTSQFHNCI